LLKTSEIYDSLTYHLEIHLFCENQEKAENLVKKTINLNSKSYLIAFNFQK
jgi:hypothetical protein